MKLGKTSTRWLFVIGLMGLVLSGCGKPPSSSSGGSGVSYDPEADPLVNPASMFEEPPGDLAQIDTEDTLYLQLDGNPNTLNPLFASTMYDINAQNVLYDSLFTFGADLVWGVNYEMVESLEESEDHRTFTVRLRPGLKWHDGQPFTAHDVVFSYEAIMDDAVPALTQKSSTAPITYAEALDDRTVVFTQAEPNATRKWALLFPVIPKHKFEVDRENHPDLKTGDIYTRLARDEVVGNGPYKLVEFVENDRVVVERWEDFHGKKPYYKRIVFRIIPDDNIALLSFEKGEVDIFEKLIAQQFAKETVESETFKRIGYKARGTEWTFGYIGWNMRNNPFFTDVRVRRAMAHAFNMDRFIGNVYYNLAEPCLGIYHPSSPMFNPEIQPIQYDVDRAAALLDEAGWLVDENDGWRYKTVDGVKTAFEFTLTIPQGSSTGQKAAAILQEDLRKLGVRMGTTVLEWAAFVEKNRAHDFEAQISAWGTGADPDTGWNIWRTEQYEEGRNYGGYSNPEVDQLFYDARYEFDYDKRMSLYADVSKVIYDEQPYLFIYNRPTLAAVNKRIRGIQFSPRGLTGFWPSMFAWWTPSNDSATSQRD